MTTSTITSRPTSAPTSAGSARAADWRSALAPFLAVGLGLLAAVLMTWWILAAVTLDISISAL